MTYEEHVDFIRTNKTKPIKITKKNILQIIKDCGKILDEQNVPMKNRWIYYIDEEGIARITRIKKDKENGTPVRRIRKNSKII